MYGWCCYGCDNMIINLMMIKKMFVLGLMVWVDKIYLVL